MVVAGFRTGWMSAIYLVSQLVLFIHLSHGIQSSLQTLGLVNRRFLPARSCLGVRHRGNDLCRATAIVVWPCGWV